jgi:glycosyltransferase involved in cell wall biosynthesis
MTDPLGQSQVISYLTGLSKKGISIQLVSFEKRERYGIHKKKIESLLAQTNITWHPVFYTKNPPILSTLFDLVKLNYKCRKLNSIYKFSLVHCRSYITSLIGLRLKKKYGIKFIFDMRAFYADERVDGGLWPQNRFIYRKIYNYFKRKELEFINNADYTISLTEKGKEIIGNWKGVKNNFVPIQVIPCCVDLEKFNPEKISEGQLDKIREQLSIQKDQKILSYVGSVGTWYLPDEMMQFFKKIKQKFPNALFLFITGETEKNIFSIANKNGVSPNDIRVVECLHHQVPEFLSTSNYSLFFIKPAFSKSGSSPTKMGEIMALGIPLICNRGVGDVESIVKDTGCGVLLNDFSDSSFQNTVEELSASNFDKQKLRIGATKYYSLERGVELYWEVYEKLLA